MVEVRCIGHGRRLLLADSGRWNRGRHFGRVSPIT